MNEKISEKSFLKKCEASRAATRETSRAATRTATREAVYEEAAYMPKGSKSGSKLAEKKCFIKEKMQCIINRLVKSVVMSFKSNSVKVVCLSVLGFCAGVFLTCILITARRPDSRHGVGGLETTAEPEYEENLSQLLAEVESDIAASEDAEALLSAVE